MLFCPRISYVFQCSGSFLGVFLPCFLLFTVFPLPPLSRIFSMAHKSSAVPTTVKQPAARLRHCEMAAWWRRPSRSTNKTCKRKRKTSKEESKNPIRKNMYMQPPAFRPDAPFLSPHAHPFRGTAATSMNIKHSNANRCQNEYLLRRLQGKQYACAT